LVVVENLQGGQLTFDLVVRAEQHFSTEPQHQGQVTLLGSDGEVDSEVDSEVYEVRWHEVVVDISFVWDSLTKLVFLRISAELIWQLCSLSPTVNR
jgi:hypothetical protein